VAERLAERPGLALAGLAALAVGCHPTDAPAGGPSTPAVSSERGPSPTPAPSPAPSPRSGCFVGTLGANAPLDLVAPDGYCVAGTYYPGARYRVGRLNLFGAGELPDAQVGRIVVVQAERRSDLGARLEASGPCPEGEPLPIQARSDWAPEEGGYRTTEERLRTASYLVQIAAPRVVELLSVVAPPAKGLRPTPPVGPPEKVRVGVRNPFDFPLEGLRLVLHYEGGSGKPMPRYETVALPRLLPGESFELAQPERVEAAAVPGGTSGWFVWTSAQIEGKSGGCEFLPSGYRR
jgi:hypothetical protein